MKIIERKNVYLSKIKRKLLKHLWLTRILLFVILLSAIGGLFMLSGKIFERIGAGYYLNLAKSILSADERIVNQVDGRTNILIMGKGGGNHEGPDLTDTMIFVSLSQKDNSITMISLPRDIWLPDLRAKLNSAYYWGNKKQSGGGIVLAKASVEKIVDQPVQYAAVIDFSGFEKGIDALGGVDVNVKQGFIDNWFPIPGKENDLCAGDPEFKCRYETITFQAGIQHMDGLTALKYVRSRHAEGDAGTDLAREARQQEVIVSVKQKLLDKKVLLSQTTVQYLLSVAGDNIETDIDSTTANALIKLIFKARNNIGSYVIPDSLLFNPPYSAKYDNLYVYIPKDGSWEAVRGWIRCVENRNQCQY